MIRTGFPSTNVRLHRAQTQPIHRLAPELSMAVSFVSDKLLSRTTVMLDELQSRWNDGLFIFRCGVRLWQLSSV